MKTYEETIARFATVQANEYADDWLMSEEDDDADILPWANFDYNTVKTIAYIYDADVHDVYADLKRYTYDNFGNPSDERFETWYNSYKESNK